LNIFQAEADGDSFGVGTPLGECSGFDNSVAFAKDEIQTFECVLRDVGVDYLPCKNSDDRSVC
jgi:hypothetical protein